jgi:predicted transcriptional regulator
MNITLEYITKYNSTPKEIIAANVRRLTEPYSAAVVAKMAGVTTNAVYNWNKIGFAPKPELEAALRLCQSLGVSENELIKEINIPKVEDDRKKCRTDGCDNPASAAYGLCPTCYQRRRRAEKKLEQSELNR